MSSSEFRMWVFLCFLYQVAATLTAICWVFYFNSYLSYEMGFALRMFACIFFMIDGTTLWMKFIRIYDKERPED